MLDKTPQPIPTTTAQWCVSQEGQNIRDDCVVIFSLCPTLHVARRK